MKTSGDNLIFTSCWSATRWWLNSTTTWLITWGLSKPVAEGGSFGEIPGTAVGQGFCVIF